MGGRSTSWIAAPKITLASLAFTRVNPGLRKQAASLRHLPTKSPNNVSDASLKTAPFCAVLKSDCPFLCSLTRLMQGFIVNSMFFILARKLHISLHQQLLFFLKDTQISLGGN